MKTKCKAHVLHLGVTVHLDIVIASCFIC